MNPNVLNGSQDALSLKKDKIWKCFALFIEK